MRNGKWLSDSFNSQSEIPNPQLAGWLLCYYLQTESEGSMSVQIAKRWFTVAEYDRMGETGILAEAEI